jgi:hypothetical protein
MSPALHAFLHHIVDYAGLFPPAALAMGPAVRGHARYRAGDASWMLGRFVVPVARLEELEAAALDLLPAADDAEPWRISALASEDAAADAARVAAFNARHAPDREAGCAVIDVLEVRAATPAACAALGAVARPGLAVYAEVPWQAPDAFPAFAAAARAVGVRLKLRTGGITADAFPPPETVLAFLVACRDAGVAAKATAGLHHPLAGEHPLTYEPGCARGAMYGFVNVFLAAALLRAGHAPDAVRPLLTERDPATFAVDAGDAIAWRGMAVDAAALADARAHALVAFGSCSFEEPLADLRALGWLPAAAAARVTA